MSNRVTFANNFAIKFRPAYYKLIEECVSQIVLHKSGLDPDFSKKRFDLDVKSILDEMKGTTLNYFG